MLTIAFVVDLMIADDYYNIHEKTVCNTLEMPYPPFVGMGLESGNTRFIVKHVWYDTDACEYNAELERRQLDFVEYEILERLGWAE